jgi:hypothetical protein
VASPMGAYAIHARFLGVNPTVPHDLIAWVYLCHSPTNEPTQSKGRKFILMISIIPLPARCYSV